MVKIFVAGANGYIGYPVVLGHKVYGLSRSIATAKKLQAEEIIPILGDASSPEMWIDQAKDVDIVIDTLGGNQIATNGAILYEAFSGIASRLRPEGPPLTYIYTSGSWVHGDDIEAVINDSTPLTEGTTLAAWCIPFERLVTGTRTPFIQGIVVRPVNVYGRSSSTLGEMLFQPASQGKIQWYGKPGGRVHQDDLADLYVHVVTKAPIIGGLTFIAANPESESMDFILSELCKVTGVVEVTYLPAESPLQYALSLSHKINPSFARDLLGWIPRKRSLGDALAEYYAA